MTRAQFAAAVRADEKWVENASLLLKRRFAYTASEARWLSLVRVFVYDLGLTLSRSADIANEALKLHPADRNAVITEKDGTAGIAIDLARFHSTYAASLSQALDIGGPRRRGRTRARAKGKSAALKRAAEYGVDLDLLREGLRLTPAERLEQLDENAAFLGAIRRVR